MLQRGFNDEMPEKRGGRVRMNRREKEETAVAPAPQQTVESSHAAAFTSEVQ